MSDRQIVATVLRNNLIAYHVRWTCGATCFHHLWYSGMRTTFRIQKFGDCCCLTLISLALCGCAFKEDRSSFVSSSHTCRTDHKIRRADVVKSKPTIWNHVPWSTQKYQNKEKMSAVAKGNLASGTPRHAVAPRKKAFPASRGERKVVQRVAWETMHTTPDRARVTGESEFIPISRLPTKSAWR